MLDNTSFRYGLQIQGRVLWALSLREIQGKQGKSKLGYVWQIVKTGFGVFVFWIINMIGGTRPPLDLPLPIFLLVGFTLWHMFSGIVEMSMEAVETNQALLTFPQITPLDLIISSAIVVWLTEIVVMALFIMTFSLAGFAIRLVDPFMFLFAPVLLGLLSLGIGLILASLAVYYEIVKHLVSMTLRILFFMSGIFFSVSQLPQKFKDPLLYNPVLNCIEMMRGSFALYEPAPYLKIWFVVALTCITLSTGLLLERHTRPKLI